MRIHFVTLRLDLFNCNNINEKLNHYKYHISIYKNIKLTKII